MIYYVLYLFYHLQRYCYNIEHAVQNRMFQWVYNVQTNVFKNEKNE